MINIRRVAAECRTGWRQRRSHRRGPSCRAARRRYAALLAAWAPAVFGCSAGVVQNANHDEEFGAPPDAGTSALVSHGLDCCSARTGDAIEAGPSDASLTADFARDSADAQDAPHNKHDAVFNPADADSRQPDGTSLSDQLFAWLDGSAVDASVPHEPDAAVPDAAVPDAAVPDAAVPDAAVPDAAVPDAAVPDAVVADATRDLALDHTPGCPAGQPCDDNDPCTVQDTCTTSGSCRGVDAGWTTVATIDYAQTGPNNSWALVQQTQWTIDRKVRRLRISGSAEGGGYCHAYWGSGQIFRYRYDGRIGYHSGDGKYYYLALGSASVPCPTFPPFFSTGGIAELCQKTSSKANALTLGDGESGNVSLPVAAIVELRGRHLVPDKGGWLKCRLEVSCK